MNNDSPQKLIEIFSKFPGIGPRQAKRFVYYLLKQTESHNKNLSFLISMLKKETGSCTECFRFFNTARENATCSLCGDENRDNSMLMVVAKDVDLDNIEKTKSYNGFYFILGGLVPILEKNPEQKVRINELLKAIEKRNDLKEIILALSASPNGDNTAEYLKRILSPIAEKKGIKISLLGRGISTGLELEYSDSDTLKHALTNRE